MTAFLVISNILFLLLVSRIFAQERSSDYFFNPFLLWSTKITNYVLDFARPIFPGVGKGAVVGLVLLLLLVFRGALLATVPVSGWQIFVGTMVQYFPRPGWGNAIAFSVLDFLSFYIHFAGMVLFMRLIASSRAKTRVTGAFAEYALPFSRLPVAGQIAALVVANAFFVYLLGTFTDGALLSAKARAPMAAAFVMNTPAKTAGVYAGLTLLSVADILSFTRQTLLLLIFASLAAAIFQNRTMVGLFVEMQNALLGRFSRRPVTVGIFDFTPVIFFIALNLVFGVVVFLFTVVMRYAGLIPAGALAY